jgi:hypothetical protein
MVWKMSGTKSLVMLRHLPMAMLLDGMKRSEEKRGKKPRKIKMLHRSIRTVIDLNWSSCGEIVYIQ